MAKTEKVKFHTKVVGVSHDNPDGSSRQQLIRKHCKKGVMMMLVPEPDNTFDPNAVAVYVYKSKLIGKSIRAQIGYLKSDVAKEFHTMTKVHAKIADVTGGTKDKATMGVNLQITGEKPKK